MTYYDFQTLIVAVVIVAHGPCGCSTKPDKCPNMKSLAAIVAPLLVTVGAASAGEIVIKPKPSDSAVVLTTSRGKVVKVSVRAKPEHTAKPEPVKDTAGFARTP